MAFIVYIVVFVFVVWAIPAILMVLIYDLPWFQALLYGFFCGSGIFAILELLGLFRKFLLQLSNRIKRKNMNSNGKI